MLRLYIIILMISRRQQTTRDEDHPEEVHSEEVRAHLSRLYDEERRAHACHTQDPSAFETWQRPARSRLVELLGLDRIAESAGHGDVPAQLDPDVEQLDATPPEGHRFYGSIMWPWIENALRGAGPPA